MPKKAIVILAEGFEEIEAVTCIDILRRADIEVTVAGLSEQVTGSRGVIITADKKLDDIATDFDACILPGGMPGATNLVSSEKVKSTIKDLNQRGKIIAAICASPAVVLAPIGVLENKSATCYPGMEGHFDNNTQYKTDNVVIDGNIITSRGPATALAFSLAIVEALCGKEVSNNLKKATLAG